MSLLDEAMAAAVGGEVRSFWAFSDVYCNTLLACERAGDFERAEQWCRVVMDFSKRNDAKPLFPFCHVTYGAILAATGRWDEAEAEFDLALRLFTIGHKGMRVIALSRLADLRIKQGRTDEAARLLDGYEEHPLAIRPAVRLHIATGRASLAAGLVRRRLEQVPADSTLAAPLLAMLVEAQLQIGNVTAASETAEMLSRLAERSEQPSIAAEAALAAGATALAAGRDDARTLLDRAVELFGSLEQPLEAARARVLAARARSGDDRELAVADVRNAMSTFERLGASRDFDAAAELLRTLGEAGPPGPKGFGELTKREDEVLVLLAEGLSNAEIAARLFITPKTVEHHVGGVLRKLGLRSRAEAAAYVARRS
jgi:DNA-binding NarL/FixJ family response regulator